MSVVAALFVDQNGVYAGLPDVDVWDEQRDARLYAGPWPVVAHPPCARWSIMGLCRPEFKRGEDGGCFEAALASVRTYGGVIEHPRYSLAWKHFGLPRPGVGGWSSSLFDSGHSTEVDQHAYGMRFRKPTWLYAIGVELPTLDWTAAGADALSLRNYHGWGNGQRSRTPEAFRDVLLGMARTARAEVAA